MATLDRNSTREEVEAAYADNASYLEDNSPAKAAAFITACRILILRTPVRAAKGSRAGINEVESPVAQWQAEIKAAQQWLAANGGSAGAASIRHVSFEDFRG